MKFLHPRGFLRAVRSFLLPGRRDQARAARVITVPAPLSCPTTEAVVVQMPRSADLSATRAAAARGNVTSRNTLQTHCNIALLSRQP